MSARTPLFPLTDGCFVCPKCGSATKMIVHVPVWVCPVCRSTFRTPLPMAADTLAEVEPASVPEQPEQQFAVPKRSRRRRFAQ